MSGRTSRRSQQAALAADAAPAAPIAEVRTRKWTKQLRTVGHLTLWKWVPGAFRSPLLVILRRRWPARAIRRQQVALLCMGRVRLTVEMS